MSVDTQHTKGVHAYGFIQNVLREGKFHRPKYWDGNTMTILMPDPSTNIRITQDDMGDYYVAPAHPEAGEAVKLAIARMEYHTNVENGYKAEHIAELLKAVRKLHCNEHYRPEPMLPFQEGVDAPARGQAGQREL